MADMRNADTFVATGWFWRAWPDLGEADDFRTKREAVDYVARRGGGGIRKERWVGNGPSTMFCADTITIPAR